MKEKGVFDVVNNTTPRRSFCVAIINSLTYAQAFFLFSHSLKIQIVRNSL